MWSCWLCVFVDNRDVIIPYFLPFPHNIPFCCVHHIPIKMCVLCESERFHTEFENEPSQCYISDLCICMVIVWLQTHALCLHIWHYLQLSKVHLVITNCTWLVNVCFGWDSWQLLPVLFQSQLATCLLFCPTSVTSQMSSSLSFSFFFFLFENVSCLSIHTFCHEQHYNWFVLLLNYVDVSSMQDIASWIYLLLSIYCCHISFPVLSLFPSPSSIFGWFGGVSAQNNNNDHASMSVSIPAWLLQHYAVILQADGRKACLCLTVEATLLQVCWFIWDIL